ncbi:unnamed protein product, partial [Timema podura]|nr:unnamed protein product [Timema podura]
AGVQLLSDTLLYSQHSDPQLRALVSTLISSVLKSALIQSGRDLSHWLGDTSLVLPGQFLELLLKGLKDESSVCCGQTLAAVGACLPDLLECVDSRQWLPILETLLDMVANPYWLVKVKLAGVVSEMPFVTIHHLVGSPDYQEKILHSVLLVLLRDENARVRHAAAEAVVKLYNSDTSFRNWPHFLGTTLRLLHDADSPASHERSQAPMTHIYVVSRTVPYLFYPVDHGGQDPVTAKAALYSRVYLSPLIVGCLQGHPSSLPQRPNISSLPAPFNVGLEGTYVASLDAALSRVVNLLSQQLLMSQSRHLVFGCCETLTLLSVEYLTTVYPQAWNCQLAPRKNSQSAGVPVSASAGLLATTLSLLTSSPVSVDLSCQQWLLHLAGNMFSGLAVNSLRTVEILSPPSQVDPHKELWAMFQDRQRLLLLMTKPVCFQLSVLSEHLLGHVLRLLSIFVHVLEDAHPVLPSTKIPVPPSLSPIKRKGRIDITETRGMSPVKIGADKEDKMEEKKSGRGVPLGLFANLPHYVKIHDMVKSAYTNYKTIHPCHVGSNARQSTLVTLGPMPDMPPSSRCVKCQTIHPRHVGSDARQSTLVTLGPMPDNPPSSFITLDCGASEKFISLLRTTLEALSQLLEIASLHEAGRVAEEILAYMRLTISIEPTSTVKCVQQTNSATYGSYAVCPQLLKSLFGTNLSARWEEEPDKRPQLGLNSGGGFYNTCLQVPYKHLTDYVSSASGTLDHISPWLNFFYKKGERKASTVFKSVNRGADKTALASYIRLFEPMVIKALKQYTVTSDVQLQCRVLLLLIQLVQLRVNYCLLDSDQIFIGFVLKQFEFIEEGQIPQP